MLKSHIVGKRRDYLRSESATLPNAANGKATTAKTASPASAKGVAPIFSISLPVSVYLVVTL